MGDGVELEAEVGESLLEEPPAEVVERFADDGGVAQVDVSFLHLLELLDEEVVHEGGQVGCAVGLAVVLALELVETAPEVEDEVGEEAEGGLGEVALHVDQELAQHVVDGRRVGLVLVRLLLLLAPLPILANGLQVGLLLLQQFPPALLLLLLAGGEELIEVLPELLEVVGLLLLFGRLWLFLIFGVGRVFVSGKGEFGVLWLSLVLGLDVRVECGVAEVGLAAVAGEVATVFVVAGAPFALDVVTAVVVLVAPGAQVGFAHCATIRLYNLNMLCFIGLQLRRPLADRQKYKDCLQEMRHYLALRKAHVSESEHLISVSSEDYSFTLPKHPLYLHSCFFSMPLFAPEDHHFLDTTYESLMILQEAFPQALSIQLVTDAESPQMEAFTAGKEEELSRRVNSNLRSFSQSQAELTPQDVETIIYLAQHHYTRKNRAIALKLLASKISPANVADLPQQSIEALATIGEGELNRTAAEIAARIRSMQSECRGKQNQMQVSNFSHSAYAETLQLQPLLFQLRESYSLQRVCSLLAHALNSEQEKEYFWKMEAAVGVVTARFLSGQFQEAGRLGGDFGELLKRYWSRRGKKWEQSQRSAVQSKIRSVSRVS